MPRLLLASFASLVSVSCNAPTVELLARDATIETTPDTTPEDGATDAYVFPDAELELPDGRVCRGHDEDGDGTPDECDDCPNVPLETNTFSQTQVGSACAAFAPFAEATTRTFFDPFLKDSTNWARIGDLNAIKVRAELPDVFSGGGGFASLNFSVVGALQVGTRPVVTTTTLLDFGGMNGVGVAGLLARASLDARSFIGCAFMPQPRRFVIVRTPGAGCPRDKPDCELVTLASKEVPPELDIAPFERPAGLRMSVKDTPEGGLVECRIFLAGVAATLNDAPKFALTLAIPQADWPPSGAIGVFTRSTKAYFGSLDVLTSPLSDSGP